MLQQKVKSIVVKFLHWMQKYTRTDMVYLTKGGFWTLMSNLIQIGIGIITTVALANLLTKDVLGTYQFVLSTAAILSMLTLSGLTKVIIRAVARGNEGALRSGVHTKLKWSIGIVIASSIVAIYYFTNGNNELGACFLIVGAFAPFIESFRLYNAYLVGKEAFRDTLVLGIWRKPLPLVATLTTLYFTDDVVVLILVYFMSNTVSLFAVYLSVLRKYDPPRMYDTDSITYSKHLSVLNIANQIASHADKILIWHFLGAVEVAIFTIAQLAVQYSGNLLNTLNTVILPKITKRDLPTLQQTLPRKVSLFTLLTIAGAGVYILAAPFVFPLLFPEYQDSIFISQILAIGFVFLPHTIYGQVFLAHKQLKSQYILSIINPILRITLFLILIPLYGIWGTVSALLIADAIGYVLVYWFFKNAKPNHS